MPYAQVSLSTLLTRLADRFESIPFFSQLDSLSSLQETMRWWNLFTGQWKGQATVNTVAATSWPTGWVYTITSPITFALRASWQSIPLKLCSIDDLDLGYRNWRSQNIASGGSAPSTPVFWAKVGINQFVIWPADTSPAHSVLIDGVTKTPILAVDPVNPTGPELAAFIDLGAEEEPILLDEALHLLVKMKLGGTYARKTEEGHMRFLRAALDKNSRLKAETPFRVVMGLDQDRVQRPSRRDLNPEAVQILQQ